MNNDFSLVTFIKLMLKWKKQILIATIGGAILTAAFTLLFLDNYYKSQAIYYPLNMGLNDRAVLFNTNGASYVDYFGSKEDVNRLLAISNSEQLVNHLITKFELVKHYEIDSNKKYWKTKLKKEFHSNYKAIKTDQGGIEVSVLDKDPKIAFAIINETVAEVNKMQLQTVNSSKSKQIKLIDSSLIEQKNIVAAYTDTLAGLIYKYNITVKTSAEGSETVNGNSAAGILEYKTMYLNHQNELSELLRMQTILSQMKVSLESNTSALSIVESASVADRKEKPVRSVIILLATMGIFFISIIACLLAEQLADLKRQL